VCSDDKIKSTFCLFLFSPYFLCFNPSCKHKYTIYIIQFIKHSIKNIVLKILNYIKHNPLLQIIVYYAKLMNFAFHKFSVKVYYFII